MEYELWKKGLPIEPESLKYVHLSDLLSDEQLDNFHMIFDLPKYPEDAADVFLIEISRLINFLDNNEFHYQAGYRVEEIAASTPGLYVDLMS